MTYANYYKCMLWPLRTAFFQTRIIPTIVDLSPYRTELCQLRLTPISVAWYPIWVHIWEPICGTLSERESVLAHLGANLGHIYMGANVECPIWEPIQFSPIWESIWGIPSGSQSGVSPLWELIQSASIWEPIPMLKIFWLNARTIVILFVKLGTKLFKR